MPFYIYRCDIHGETEIYHAPGEKAPTACETCGKPLVRRFTMPNVNWGGQPPSKKAHLPNVMAAVKEAERRRYDRGAPGELTQI